jgi:hypothetical protein
MPLPTLEVSDEIATRVLKAFENRTDDTTGTVMSSEDAYLEWLRRVLLEKVVAFEAQASTAALQQELT